MTISTRTISALAATLLIGSVACNDATAAWPTSAATPFLVGDVSGDNNIPQLAALPDGGCYILWRSWDVPAGYSTRLQRLDAAGNELWPHNGVVVAVGDQTFTIVGGADLAVASDGSALVSVDSATDPANPGVRQCNVQKISTTGTKLWGTGGANVRVSSGAGWGVPAHICAMPDGGCVVAYNTDVPANVGNDYITLVRFSASGATVWPGPKFIFDAANTLVVTDIQPGDSDTFIVSWIKSATQSAFFTQKFTGLGNAAPGWPTPVTLDASGLTNRDFPTFLSDGNGGAIYAWRSYANNGFASPSEAKLQHILSNGTVKFAAGGLNCFDSAFDPTQGRQTASLAFTRDAGTGDYTYFVAATQGPISNGVSRSSVVQKIDHTGNLMWTGAGFTSMPQSFNSQITVGNTTCVATGDGGCMVLGTVGRGLTTIDAVNYAVKVVDGFGFPNSSWSVVFDTDATSGKGRMSAARQATSNDALVAYTRTGGLNGRIAAAKIANADGAPGIVPVAPAIDVDLPFSITACDGDTVQLSIQVSGTAPLSYRWMRHYAEDIPANPDAFWYLSNGNSAFGCIIPDDGTTYAGVDSATLTIQNVHALPATITNTAPVCSVTTNPANNLYRCLVFNAADALVYSAQVFIDVQPCGCPADFDNSGTVDVVDLFDFLDAWFAQTGVCAGSCTADFDGDTDVDVVDLFDFLDAWFATNGQTSC